MLALTTLARSSGFDFGLDLNFFEIVDLDLFIQVTCIIGVEQKKIILVKKKVFAHVNIQKWSVHTHIHTHNCQDCK